MDKAYKPELNFLTEFNLSRNGMIEEVKTEFDIIQLGLSQKDNKNASKELSDRIIVVTLRKMLCEKSSLLIKLEPSFKMPPLSGISFESEDKLKMILPPYEINENNWIALSDWQKQKIAYFDKGVSDLPYAINEETYNVIRNKLNKTDKNLLDSLMTYAFLKYENEDNPCYVIKDCDDNHVLEEIFRILKLAGYYDLTLYDFIKHMADKRGAHIDIEIAPLVKILNDASEDRWTPVKCLAIQMIYAAQVQIPELKDYWPELTQIYKKS